MVLWTGAQVSLSVFFHAKATEPRRLVDQIEKAQLAPTPTLVTVRAEGPTIPVYFDFEGLWCHLAGIGGTQAYPHGLGGGMATTGREEDGGTLPRLSAHQRWAVGELLRRPFVAGERGRGGHLVGPLGLPFSQRRLIERGWVTHRTILEPGRVPPYQGRAADQIVLITGTPRPSALPETLFAVLGSDCRVFPFLFVTGSERWMLGALGGSNPPPASNPPRRPVLATLREHLEGIEIVQEPAASSACLLDHRYDRLPPLKDHAASA